MAGPENQTPVVHKHKVRDDLHLLPVEQLTPQEVGHAIRSRLKLLERDLDWNSYTWTDRSGTERSQRHLFGSGAHAQSGKVSVTYISYQGHSTLDADQARDYLAWLRAGNKGRHHEAQREGAIRQSKADAAKDAWSAGLEVAYEHTGGRWMGTKVIAAVQIPEGSTAVPSTDVCDGDKVYWEGRWRTVRRVSEYVPPEPERAHELAAQIQDATRRGDYEQAEDAARKMAAVARQLADGRDFEQQLAFANGSPVTLTPECKVAIKRTRS